MVIIGRESTRDSNLIFRYIVTVNTAVIYRHKQRNDFEASVCMNRSLFKNIVFSKEFLDAMYCQGATLDFRITLSKKVKNPPTNSMEMLVKLMRSSRASFARVMSKGC